jgi:hypothetical protein
MTSSPLASRHDRETGRELPVKEVPMSSANTRQELFHLTTGCPVFTSDGQQLGEIKEVRDDMFKVDTSWARDIWFARTSVASASDERVTLKFADSDAKRYRLDAPSDEGGRVEGGPVMGEAPGPEYPFSPGNIADPPTMNNEVDYERERMGRYL